MGGDIFFKKSLFGGFNKDDVLNYIENIQASHIEADGGIRQKEEQIAAAQAQIQQFEARLAMQSRKIASLAKLNDEYCAQIYSLEQQSKELTAKFESIESDCDRLKAVEAQIGALLLDAVLYSNKMTEKAKTVATSISNDAKQTIVATADDVSKLSADIAKISGDFSRDITELVAKIESLSGSLASFAGRFDRVKEEDSREKPYSEQESFTQFFNQYKQPAVGADINTAGGATEENTNGLNDSNAGFLQSITAYNQKAENSEKYDNEPENGRETENLNRLAGEPPAADKAGVNEEGFSASLAEYYKNAGESPQNEPMDDASAEPAAPEPEYAAATPDTEPEQESSVPAVSGVEGFSEDKNEQPWQENEDDLIEADPDLKEQTPGTDTEEAKSGETGILNVSVLQPEENQYEPEDSYTQIEEQEQAAAVQADEVPHPEESKLQVMPDEKTVGEEEPEQTEIHAGIDNAPAPETETAEQKNEARLPTTQTVYSYVPDEMSIINKEPAQNEQYYDSGEEPVTELPEEEQANESIITDKTGFPGEPANETGPIEMNAINESKEENINDTGYTAAGAADETDDSVPDTDENDNVQLTAEINKTGYSTPAVTSESRSNIAKPNKIDQLTKVNMLDDKLDFAHPFEKDYAVYQEEKMARSDAEEEFIEDLIYSRINEKPAAPNKTPNPVQKQIREEEDIQEKQEEKQEEETAEQELTEADIEELLRLFPDGDVDANKANTGDLDNWDITID